ncbi:MAG TPA: cytochrome c3 family protein, partial [Polyangiaceae bacterium]
MQDLHRTRGHYGYLLCLLALCVAALAAACREPQTPARFPHRVHLAGLDCGSPGKPACLSCNSCHAPSQAARVDKLPLQQTCESCHQKDREQVLPILSITPPRPYGEISIDHDKHLAMPGINGQCVPCHGGVLKTNESTLPPMSKCFTCHEHKQQWDKGECTQCHGQRDLMRTFPQTFMRHDADFARHHGSMATQQGQLCLACHSESTCQSCHDGSQNMTIEARKPERLESQQVHRGDFMVRHALEAASQPARCLTCHTPQTCDSCHAARGVSGGLSNGRNPHPPGWVGTSTTSSDF